MVSVQQQRLDSTAIFTNPQQDLIGQIFHAKFLEFISSSCLLCSHCSSSTSNSSNLQLSWSPADSPVFAPTTPLQGFDRQLKLLERQLSELTAKVEQLLDNHPTVRHSAANISTNNKAAKSGAILASASVAESASSYNVITQRLKDLEYRLKKFESSVQETRDQRGEIFDTARLLEEMHANFETTMAKLQSALTDTVNQQQLGSESNSIPNSNHVEFEKRFHDLAERSLSTEITTDQLRSNVNKLMELHSVFVNKHEVLSTVISSVGSEQKELAEFIRVLSDCTASDIIELKAIVESIARVTGMSEKNAEALIREALGKAGEDMEHLKRQQQLAERKISELLLAKDDMAKLQGSAYQNSLPYLNFLTEVMQGECEKYKNDLNAMAERLSEHLNAKVAQAIQQSLSEKHQVSKGQLISPSAGQAPKYRPPVATRPKRDNFSTSVKAVATAPQESTMNYGETVLKAKDTPTNLQPPPEETNVKYIAQTPSKKQQSKELTTADFETNPKQLADETDFTFLNDSSAKQKAYKKGVDNSQTSHKPELEFGFNTNVTDDRLPTSYEASISPGFKQLTASKQRLDSQLSTDSTSSLNRSFTSFIPTIVGVTEHVETEAVLQRSPSNTPSIDCLVVGHDSARTHRLIHAYINKLSPHHKDTNHSAQTNVSVAIGFKSDRGIVYNAHVANFTDTTKLKAFLSCDIIIICFSVIDETSYREAKEMWPKQVKKVFPEKPYLLVGTQIDKRHTLGPNSFRVSHDKGLQLSQKIKAADYFECSAFTTDGVQAVFRHALQLAIRNTK